MRIVHKMDKIVQSLIWLVRIPKIYHISIINVGNFCSSIYHYVINNRVIKSTKIPCHNVFVCVCTNVGLLKLTFKVWPTSFFFYKVIMNPLVTKLFIKISTCGYDEMAGTPKELMLPTLAQNTNLHNQLVKK